MTLVLETLRSDETLDTGSLGVGFLAFAFRLDFATDDELADLQKYHPLYQLPCLKVTCLRKEGNENSHHHP